MPNKNSIRLIFLLTLVAVALIAWKRLSPTVESLEQADRATGAAVPLPPRFPQPPRLEPSLSEPQAEAHSHAHAHVIRLRDGIILPDLGDVVERVGIRGEALQFPLETFNGTTVEIRVTRASVQAGGRAAAIRGEIAGAPGSLVALTQVGAAVSGSIQIPTEGLVYEVRSADGVVSLEEIDVEALGECGTCQTVETELFPMNPTPPPKS